LAEKESGKTNACGAGVNKLFVTGGGNRPSPLQEPTGTFGVAKVSEWVAHFCKCAIAAATYRERSVKIAVKTHFTVVRNAAYRAGDFKTRSRHNERENDVYQNGDVILERSNFKVRQSWTE
jgi:hypothetical protein